MSPIDKQPNIPAAFFSIARDLPDGVVCTQAEIPDGAAITERRFRDITFRETSDRVLRLAGYLRSCGLGKGDRAAILSSSRHEWMEADLAILSAGGVSVSIYQSLKPHDIGYILFDSGASIVFAENQEQVDKLRELLGGPCPIPATEERPASDERIPIRKVIAFDPASGADDLVVSFADAAKAEPLAVEEAGKGQSREDLAALVYTSGTTGPPKGVAQSHGNHLANVRQSEEAGLFNDTSSIMVFLPLAHSFAKLMGYIGCLTPAKVCYPAVVSRAASKLDPRALSHDIRLAGATIVPIVPRFLEKMKAALEAKAAQRGPAGWLLRLTLWSSATAAAARRDGRAVPGIANLAYGMCEPIRARIRRELFGERFRYAISGGAKLPVPVNEFFDALEIEVLEGYGLTETCVATNLTRPGNKRIGSVGPVLSSDIRVRIAEDGEILFKGPNVTRGYYRRETATRAAWDSDGWFHTGDLGKLDEDGNLYIVGRKKELIVTAGGKKIGTENIEQLIKASPYISQAVLVGDGKPYCAALVTLDEKAIEAAAAKAGWGKIERPHEDPRVRDLVWKDVEKVNSGLASFESIKKIAILPHEMTVENELLTPTFKVKRGLVTKRFEKEIEAMYES